VALPGISSVDFSAVYARTLHCLFQRLQRVESNPERQTSPDFTPQSHVVLGQRAAPTNRTYIPIQGACMGRLPWQANTPLRHSLYFHWEGEGARFLGGQNGLQTRRIGDEGVATHLG